MLKHMKLRNKILFGVGLPVLLIYSLMTGLLVMHLRPSSHLLWQVLGVGSASMLLITLVIYILARHIVRPLYVLVQVSQDLARGNFKKRAGLDAHDEFGMAGRYIDRAFDIVVDKLFWYEGMLDAIPFPISVTDPEMRWTFINRAAEEILGKNRQAALGQPCSEWNVRICGTDQCGIALLRQGKTTSEFYHPESDTHHQVDTAWLYNTRGEKVGHIEIVQDTTEAARLKKKADDRNWLRSGEAELNNLMRGDQDIAELGRRIIAFICQYLKAGTGAFYLMDSREEVLKLTATYAYKRRKALSSRFRPGEGIVGQAALEKAPILLSEIPADYIKIDSGLGSARPRNILVAPFLSEGQVKGVIEIGAFHTFTGLETEFLEMAVKSIGTVVSMAQSRTRMKALLEKTQIQAEKLQVQQEELRQSNTELEKQTEALRRSESDLLAQQEELRVTNEELEERTRDLEIQRDDIRHKNEALEAARSELDRKARDLEIAGKYKSEFLANMSHELRTPLNSILILSQLLSENKGSNLTEKEREFAKTIHSSGADLLSLINEILDLSKVEAGKLELITEEMNLSELTDNVRRTFGQVATQKGLSLDIRTSADAPAFIHTDAKRVWQIVKNLLSNAFKFTEQGGITLEIGRPDPGLSFSSGHLLPGKVVALDVSDTGIGIPQEKQAVIFEAFQQADGTTSRKYGGTGLGLSISREFARFLGGEIRLKSAPGQGSTFTLYLPERIDPSDAGPAAPEPAPSSAPRSPSPDVPPAPSPTFVKDDRRHIREGDKSLLIIEDDPHFSRILLDLAREKGFKGLVAEDGETGLHFADFYRPGAIILDVGLPGINGWTVMERLKGNPDTRHIPVHFISALDYPLDAMKMGAVGFLTKPVSVEMLEEAFEKIEQVISRPVKRLLVIEDDEAQMRSIAALIGNGDVQIKSANTAEAAYEVLRKEIVDCIILDLGLGEMSGFDLLARIRKEKHMAQIPVIIYTGREISREEEAGLQKYADSIIIKGARSPERLLDETTLFLHRVEAHLPPEKQKMLNMTHKKETLFENKKVLIVDDDMRNVFALASVLEEKGVRLIEARNGREGLEKLDQHPDTALVLMDIMMPEMDGYEAMREIRKQECFRNLPVIALTAKAMKGDKRKCIEAGASDYLAKPVDTERLLSLMRVWLY